MDEALLRPGRFDLHATIPNPGPKAREQVLSIHARKINVAADVDFALIARGTPGFSGADLANLLNEGAIRAAKDGRTEVTAKDIDDSKDTKLLGGDVPAEKVLDEAEQAIVAVHESGHAIISLLEGDHDPIHKGTVVPRGRSLGVVVSAPTRDRALLSKRYLKARLTLMMGGRAAEELKFGADMITSGAVADIEEATRIARIMVSKYGFGLKISTRDPNSSAAFGMSEKSKEDVDAEVENLVQEALSRAMEIMSANRPALDALSSRFLRDETLNGEEIRSIVFEAIKTSTPVSVDNLNIKAVA
jgi:cell division protease FtsH